MGWSREHFLSLLPDEQRFWFANDRYEQREYEKLRQYKMMWGEGGDTISDPAAMLELELRKI